MAQRQLSLQARRDYMSGRRERRFHPYRRRTSDLEEVPNERLDQPLPIFDPRGGEGTKASTCVEPTLRITQDLTTFSLLEDLFLPGDITLGKILRSSDSEYRSQFSEIRVSLDRTKVSFAIFYASFRAYEYPFLASIPSLEDHFISSNQSLNFLGHPRKTCGENIRRVFRVVGSRPIFIGYVVLDCQ
ncbi:hypothetical protein WG66_007578 [Moniliophthora roreri]|nr:hypothetical protein WG66_007578 [Moniliophthora roreri]